MAELQGTRTREDTGGKATSAVPDGTTGTSAVTGVEPGTADRGCVVNTSAGDWMTPMVGGVSEAGKRSSSDREKPYATSAAAATTPTVTATKVLRDRDRSSGSIVSTTIVTLAR